MNYATNILTIQIYYFRTILDKENLLFAFNFN
jgi:hypothetical protein